MPMSVYYKDQISLSMSQHNVFMLIVCANTNWTNLNIRYISYLWYFFKYHKFVWIATNCFHLNLYNILLVILIIYIKYYFIAYLHNDSLPRWSQLSAQYTFTCSCIFFQIPFPLYISYEHNQPKHKMQILRIYIFDVTCWLS